MAAAQRKRNEAAKREIEDAVSRLLLVFKAIVDRSVGLVRRLLLDVAARSAV